MYLTIPQAEYLVAVYRLSLEKEAVRSQEIARTLSVSPPSVHRMMNKMESIGLVNKPRFSQITLTEHGRKAGESLNDQYALILQTLQQALPELRESETTYKCALALALEQLQSTQQNKTIFCGWGSRETSLF